MPNVLNKRTDWIPDSAIYVGRPSKWGNPFTIGEHGDRAEVIRLYGVWLRAKLALGSLDITELTGHDLVCWCAPSACHADLLLELANETTPEVGHQPLTWPTEQED